MLSTIKHVISDPEWHWDWCLWFAHPETTFFLPFMLESDLLTYFWGFKSTLPDFQGQFPQWSDWFYSKTYKEKFWKPMILKRDLFTPMDSPRHCAWWPAANWLTEVSAAEMQREGREEKKEDDDEEDLLSGNCFSLECSLLTTKLQHHGRQGGKQWLIGYSTTSCCYPHFVLKFGEQKN